MTVSRRLLSVKRCITFLSVFKHEICRRTNLKKMKQLLQAIITSLLLLLTSYATDCQSYSQQKQKADRLVKVHDQGQGPGLAITVKQNGRTLYKKQQGLANLEYRIPISDSTVFLVGSISKQFTTFSVLLLEQEGKLSLDAPITRYLPELVDLPHTISLRQLANHTSGFRNNYDLNRLRGRRDEELIGQSEMVALLLRQKGLNFKPGERFQYSNAGYVLLAEIVSRVSGLPFSTFVQEHILSPLGMQNSMFLEDPGVLVINKADSYVRREEGFHYLPMNRSIVGSTGLYTTTEDLSIWAQSYDRLLAGSSSHATKMAQPSLLNSGERIPYGLGLETKQYRGVTVEFHGGGDAGYRAYLLRVPEHRFSVAVTGNYEAFNPLNLAYGMIDIFLAEKLDKQPETVPPSYTTEELESFIGDYQVFPGLYITIFAKNDTLYFTGYGSAGGLALPPLVEPNAFEFPHRPHSKIVFFDKGLKWHFSDFSYPGQRVSLSPPTYDEESLHAYTGTFASKELETRYTFVLRSGSLIATHAFNPDIIFRPIAPDTFISIESYFGRVEFRRDAQGQITHCLISGQKAYQIFFEKTNTP